MSRVTEDAVDTTMASLFDHDAATVARQELGRVVQRMTDHVLAPEAPVSPRHVRELALEVIACAARVEMAEAIVSLDEDGDDAFTRFMAGDEADDLTPYVG